MCADCTKFFGCELGAQSKFEEKSARAVVNGKHDTETLAKLLNIFIDKFVLCPTCTLPETDLIIYIKKEDIRRKCKACGADNGVDLMHKLVTFIMNHPDEDPRYVKVVGGKGYACTHHIHIHTHIRCWTAHTCTRAGLSWRT